MAPLGRTSLSLLLITLFTLLCLSSCTKEPEADGAVVSVEEEAEPHPWSTPRTIDVMATKADNRGAGSKARHTPRTVYIYPKEVTLNKIWQTGGTRSYGIGETTGGYLMRCYENKNEKQFKASIYYITYDGAFLVLLTVKVLSCDTQILKSITVMPENVSKPHKVRLYFENKECKEYKSYFNSPMKVGNAEKLTENECSGKANRNGWKDVTKNSKYGLKNEYTEEEFA